MNPFQFLTEASKLNEDILRGKVNGADFSIRFVWGSDEVNVNDYALMRFNGTAKGFMDMYNSCVESSNINDVCYHPQVPEIDVIILPYERGVLTFVSNEDHQNLPNFHNWEIKIDYRIYYR